MDKDKEKSRTDLIIHEIKCGGFADSELEEIIDVCTDILNGDED